LVLTSLTKQALPVIRYRTRDRTRLLPPTARSMRRLAHITARTDDMLIVLGVNVFPSAIKDVVSSFYPATTGEIQIVLDKPGPGVAPPLKVVAECRAEPAAAAALKSAIERKIKATLSISASVVPVPAGALPRYEMKGQLVKKTYEDEA